MIHQIIERFPLSVRRTFIALLLTSALLGACGTPQNSPEVPPSPVPPYPISLFSTAITITDRINQNLNDILRAQQSNDLVGLGHAYQTSISLDRALADIHRLNATTFAQTSNTSATQAVIADRSSFQMELAATALAQQNSTPTPTPTNKPLP